MAASEHRFLNKSNSMSLMSLYEYLQLGKEKNTGCVLICLVIAVICLLLLCIYYKMPINTRAPAIGLIPKKYNLQPAIPIKVQFSK